MAVATCRAGPSDTDPLPGADAGAGATTSGSSGSSDVRQRRHRLFMVRNCTRRQRSHLTTSRESTGARVVAIRLWEMPERASNLTLDPATRVQAGGTLRPKAGLCQAIYAVKTLDGRT